MAKNKSFYVDSSCIICDTCTSIISNCFKINFELDKAEVHKQPAYTEEEEKCFQALRACPVSAIRLKND